MKKNHLLLGLVLMGAFASCTNETDEPTSISGKEVTFNIGITPMTRTATDGLVTTFKAQDKIGIFAGDKSNIYYILQDNNTDWSGETITMEGATDFYAYYPYYADNNAKSFTHTVDIDQSAGYNFSDLLLAKTSATGTEETVTLTFDHALALVEVDATQATDINGTITGISLQAKAESTVDLTNQTAAVKTDATSEYIQMCKVTDGKYRAVVPAQRLTAGKCIFINTDATMYSCTISAATLQAAKLNTFTIGKDGGSANFKISGGVNNWGTGSTAGSTTEENYIRTTLDDFTTNDIKKQQNYNGIPVDTWFYRYRTDADIDDDNGFVKIENDAEVSQNILHIKMPADDGVSYASLRLVGYHLNPGSISGRFKVQVMAKGISTDTKLRCYLRTGKFKSPEGQLGEGFFANNNNNGVAVTTTENLTTNKYSSYEFSFDLDNVQKNSWSYTPSLSSPEMVQDMYICFNFIEKIGGEIKLYDFKFIPLPKKQESTE